MDGRQVQEATDEWYTTIVILNDFNSGVVALTVDQYKKLPGAFFDIYRLFRRLRGGSKEDRILALLEFLIKRN